MSDRTSNSIAAQSTFVDRVRAVVATDPALADQAPLDYVADRIGTGISARECLDTVIAAYR